MQGGGDIKATENAPAQSGMPLSRPLRVLLCPDQPDWAFDNIADNVIRYAPEQFEFSKRFTRKPPDRDLGAIIECIASENIDVVHFFWREDLFEFLRPPNLLAAADRIGLALGDIIEIIGTRAYTTSVYDHLHTAPERVAERIDSFHLIDSYSVSSMKLQHIYSTLSELPDPDALITDGVDLEFFSPRFASGTARHPPVIGWVGNSSWGKSQKGDPKGFFRLFQPALDILTSRGVQVRSQVADPQVRLIPFSEMPAFYQGIDLLACTSAAEGTPNPVLEAMACGVPIVSTDVGIVPDLFGPQQSALIQREPEPESFADALQMLLEDRLLYNAISQENTESIRSWSWKQRVEPWWNFWRAAYQKARDPRLARRRMVALERNCISHEQAVARHDRGWPLNWLLNFFPR
ncbi:MAG: glycosyltransferase family 4 protein [Alphaproteobacteria bacterium]|nr:glycosyltransferase family 4 protein [Alphaproteobacteria bacterium]